MASTEIVPAAARQISTPEGALALRQTLCSAAARCLDADIDQARALVTPELRAVLPLAQQEAHAKLAPALGAHFKRTVSPTLALVAPVGMTTGDQKAWLATAAETLSGIPADLLEMGCTAARKVVDHPAKIVPAIFKEVGRMWERRRRDAADVAQLIALAAEPEQPAPSYVSSDEARSILMEVGLVTEDSDKSKRPARSGPPRHPGPADLASVARELSIDLAARLDDPAPDISGLSVAEIFQRRDYALGRDIDRAVPIPGNE